MLKFIKNKINNWMFQKFEYFALYKYLVYGDRKKLNLTKKL